MTTDILPNTDNSQLYRIKADEMIFFKVSSDEEEMYKTETLKKDSILLLIDNELDAKSIKAQYDVDWPEGFIYCVMYHFDTKTRLSCWHPPEDKEFFSQKFELCDSKD